MLDGDDFDSAGPGVGDNSGDAPDDIKRALYREALKAKMVVEGVETRLRSVKSSYQAVLKRAKKEVGKATADAIKGMLETRFEDPDVVVVQERERLKMYELSGFLDGIMAKITARYDVATPTAKEEKEGSKLAAFDEGFLAGRLGHDRDICDAVAGTEEHVEWHRGWRSGQAAIAAEMAKPAPRVKKPADAIEEVVPGILN